MSDQGQEAVGQALLITAVAISVLGTAELGGVVVHSFSRLIAALG